MSKLSGDFRRNGRFKSGLAFLSLVFNLVPLTTADEGAAREKPNPGLGAGTEVVLKASDTPIFDQGKIIPSHDHLAFLIERVEDERVLIVSRDKSLRGWVLQEQVVPIDRAIEHFTQALANDTKNTDLLWLRGRICFYLNEDDRALTNLNMAVRLEPDQARFYITRSMVWLHKQQPDKAIEDCDKAIQLGSDSSLVQMIRADAWIAKNEPRHARDALDQALRLHPTNPSGRSERSPNGVGEQDAGNGLKPLVASVGDSQGGQGSAKAPADDSDASARDPKNLGDLLDSGNGWHAKKEYDKALAAFNEVIRLDPTYAPAFAARARTWGKKHYRDRELADISVAIKLDPNNAAFRIARGESWSAQGVHERAMADYDEAIRLAPNDPAKYISRGNEWRRHLKLDEALADYTHALQINPRYAAAYIARGQTWKQRQVYDQAIREFSALIQIDPNNSEGHRALARILATCYKDDFRDGKRAVDEATRACELTRWQDPDCLDTLAAAYAESGDYQAALKWQTQAIRLVRQNVPSALLRAQDVAGRRGVGFDDRLAFYKSKKPTRE